MHLPADCAFQSGMNGEKDRSYSVDQAVLFAGKVRVESCQQSKSFNCGVLFVDPQKGIRQCPCRVGDHECIPRIFSELKMILQFEGWNLVRRVQ